jgi:VanZ family protein
LPSAPTGWLDWAIKKGLHAAGYAVLALLWHRPLARAGIRWPALVALVVAAAYAALDEWHQTFVPGRHGHLSDVAIDVAGAVAALGWTRARVGPSRR